MYQTARNQAEKFILYYLFCFLFIFIQVSISHAADPIVPGSYATTIKGQLGNGVHYTKLAMMSFQPDGTLRQDLWIWYSDQKLHAALKK